MLTVAAAFALAACPAEKSAGDKKGNAVAVEALAPAMALTELREAGFTTTLSYERPLDDGQSFTACLVSYRHSGLTLYAMVAVPKGGGPDAAYPVVIANHGYVPDPARYGITADGVDSRPGDYYRALPELFTSRGFLTVIPDYRGHNSSEGFAYIDPQDEHSSAYYAEDVVALVAGISSLDSADSRNVFMWSHSMGGAVSMRVLLATGRVRASSFWATMPVDDLQPWFGELDGPVIIHHAADDESTDSKNSERLAEMLDSIGHVAALYRYDGSQHFFSGEMLELAADRDAAFFRANSAQ